MIWRNFRESLDMNEKDKRYNCWFDENIIFWIEIDLELRIGYWVEVNRIWCWEELWRNNIEMVFLLFWKRGENEGEEKGIGCDRDMGKRSEREEERWKENINGGRGKKRKKNG